MDYGFKTYKKIDVFIKLANGYDVYMHSTNACKRCKDAVKSAFEHYNGHFYADYQGKNGVTLTDIKQLYARFDKTK